jgi:serine/threonine protein kinase/WD40 repeat protein
MSIDHDRARQIFIEALGKVPPEQRAAFLSARCGEDLELHRHVENLLQAHGEGGSFLDHPAAGPAGTAAYDLPAGQEPAARERAARRAAPAGSGVQAGMIVGPYKLIQPIGEGGMGTVWMAQQIEPVKRLVALKIIKPGMDHGQVIARFEAERQALALMEHANIARVLDAGTTPEGQPYFAMELVKGVPITRYCDEHHLTPRERLELFVPVCQAVQHAHQKGIIHRDLKPSNVLVALYDGRPVPKVIDFGVAKAMGQPLTEKTLVTGFGAIVGTLEYMAPEQAELNQLDIDTRSDIYSLGVLLYELLTGTTPLPHRRLQEAALLEVLRLIREEEPPRPSTRLSESKETLPAISQQRHTEPARLMKLVRGELDWIVMKCLEKDRSRRYETANALAQDVQRHLHGELVLACPPSAGYRLRKFVRRHQAPVVAALLVFLALVAGILGTTLGLVEADAAWREAVTNEGRARAAAAAESDANRQLQIEQANLKFEQHRTRTALDRETAAKQQLTRALSWQGLALADREWRLGNLDRAEALLDACPVELRHFEWHYLKRRCHQELFRSDRHTRAIALNRDGQRLAGLTRDGDVHQLVVWDTLSGRVRFAVPCASDHKVPQLLFSPDGKYLASTGTLAGTVTVWDAETGKQLHVHPIGSEFLVGLCFSPDSGQLAAYLPLSGILKIWDPATGIVVQEFAVDAIPRLWLRVLNPPLVFLHTGKLIQTLEVNAQRRAIKIWDVTTGKIVRSIPLAGLPIATIAAAFSRQGECLALANSNGTTIAYDARTGRELRYFLKESDEEIDDTSTSSWPAFHPDGNRLAVVRGFGTVQISYLKAEKLSLTIHAHARTILQLAFSGDGTHLATLGADGTAKLWDASVSQEARTLAGEIHRHYAVAFHPGGKTLATVTSSPPDFYGVKVFDARTGQVVRSEASPYRGVPSLSWHADGVRLMVGKQLENLRIDLLLGEEKSTKLAEFERGRKPCFSPGGNRLALVRHDPGLPGHRVHVHDLVAGKEMYSVLLGKEHQPALAFDADGRRLAVGQPFVPGPLRIVDLTTRQEWVPVVGKVAAVAFARKEPCLAACVDGKIRVWDLAAREEISAFDAAARFLALTSDGQRLASATPEGTVILWDVASGRDLLTLTMNGRNPAELQFSPDDCFLVCRDGMNRTIRLWDGTPWPAKGP